MLRGGMIDWKTYGRAVRNARAELEQAANTTAPAAAPDAITAGSAQAQKFVYDQSRGVQKLTRDDIPKKALAEATTQTKWLDRIEKNTRNLSGDSSTEVDF
jgi:hypothetical protein